MKTLRACWYVIVLVLNAAASVILLPRLHSTGAIIGYGLFMLGWVSFGAWMLMGDLGDARRLKASGSWRR